MKSARAKAKERNNEPARERSDLFNRSAPAAVSSFASPLHDMKPFIHLASLFSPASIPVAGILQAKLTISQPEDEYEQEADRVAERVMRMPEPPFRIQRKCNCGECEKCAGKRVRLRRHAINNAASNMEAPGIVHDVLRSQGQPLDQSTRSFFEPRFGHDLSQVRIHHDAQAAESARAVNAMAYTVGQNVVFGAGYYEPHTNEGRRLIAHELTDFIQQGGESSSQVQDNSIQDHSKFEARANDVTEQVAPLVRVESVSSLSNGMLQRDDGPNATPDLSAFDNDKLEEEHARVLAESDPAKESYLLALEAEMERRKTGAPTSSEESTEESTPAATGLDEMQREDNSPIFLPGLVSSLPKVGGVAPEVTATIEGAAAAEDVAVVGGTVAAEEAAEGAFARSLGALGLLLLPFTLESDMPRQEIKRPPEPKTKPKEETEPDPKELPSEPCCCCANDIQILQPITRIDDDYHMGHRFQTAISLSYTGSGVKIPCTLEWCESTNMPYEYDWPSTPCSEKPSDKSTQHFYSDRYKLGKSSFKGWDNRPQPCPGTPPPVIDTDEPKLAKSSILVGKGRYEDVRRILRFLIIARSGQGCDCPKPSVKITAIQNLFLRVGKANPNNQQPVGIPDWKSSEFLVPNPFL